MTISPAGLSRKSLGTAGLVILSVAASGPMLVVGGGVIVTFAATGVIGVPLSFLVLTPALLLVVVGLVVLGRDHPHAAGFYAYLARGISPTAGVAGAGVALIGYNALQIGLYALFAATAASTLGGPWWFWALVGWGVVALLGVRHIELNTRVIASVLAVEITVIVLFIVAALGHPADPGTASVPLLPRSLLTDGVGGVFVFSVAAFIGFECVVVYGEEVTSSRSVRRAALGMVAFLGLFYAVASWAITVVVGSSHVVDAARDPAAGLPFSVLGEYFGPLVGSLGVAMLLLSILSAMISFHNIVARYVFGLAREGVLPSRLAATGGAIGGVPVGGSITQSVTAVIIIAAFAVSGADPVAVMFPMLTTIGSIGVLALLASSSLSVILYFRRTPHERPPLRQWLVAPLLGFVFLVVILAVTVSNVGTVTGDPANQVLPWLLPGLIVLAAIAGVIWAQVLRHNRPHTWMSIGRGTPRPLAVLDMALSHLGL
ncbi:MAG: APC family permease [Pseudonocardia sp.]|nr:APC family permease [Pseudonocardia sp.]